MIKCRVCRGCHLTEKPLQFTGDIHLFLCTNIIGSMCECVFNIVGFCLYVSMWIKHKTNAIKTNRTQFFFWFLNNSSKIVCFRTFCCCCCSHLSNWIRWYIELICGYSMNAQKNNTFAIPFWMLLSHSDVSHSERKFLLRYEKLLSTELRKENEMIYGAVQQTMLLGM